MIEAVSVVDVDGKTLEFKGSTLDPERLPLQLRLWSDRMQAAKPDVKLVVTLQLRRHREAGGMEFEDPSPKVELEWDIRLMLSNDYKRELRSAQVHSEDTKKRILFQPHPRFIWLKICFYL